MKIAVCMHGITGGCGGKNGAGEPTDIAFCKRTFDKHVIKKNPEDKIDFFVHSWSVNRSAEILDLYQPVNSIIEPQIKFSDDLRVHLSNSRWYSSTKAIELKAAHEKRNGFVYDYVMTMRFDVVWKKNLRFADHDSKYFWASLAPHRETVGEGKKVGLFLEDFWFFSSSANMDYLGKIYQEIPSRNNHKAAYLHISKGCEIKYTMMPPRDFDLYRWWSGKDRSYPRKWYNEPTHDGSEFNRRK